MSKKTTAVVQCKCPHSGQDRIYGIGKRVANLLSKDAKSNLSEFRCSVCGVIHAVKE